jgi:hypothetical protein
MQGPGTRKAPERHRQSVSTVLAAVSCAVAIAACGSVGPSSAAATGSGDVLALKFAECMRSHGVPDFPDPGKPVGGPGSRISKQAPAFQSAEQTCDRLTNNPQPKGSPLPEGQRVAALASAQCMRTHGVPNFPDPTFPSTGGEYITLPPGATPQSPAFLKAQKVCGQRP